MKTHLEQIESELKEELLALHNLDPQERYTLARERIDDAIGELKKFMEAHDPMETGEEIYIFKHVRPQLLSFRIEEAMRYNLSINQPIGTRRTVAKYLEDTFKGLQSFFRLNTFYYQYYKNGLEEMDHLYFTGEGNSLMLPVPEITEEETPFSRPMSNLFAKFMAYERLQLHIMQQLEVLNGGREQDRPQLPAPDIKWTGEVLSLVELIYGIWLTGQLNSGNASLNQIVRWFELHFHVSIGVVQRKFAQIERRKRFSVTKLLDQMRDAILRKLDHDQGA
ncbi:RteC domain-containing protein [Mucilaginibacter sp. Bleaf8]|uniref:RteC domain-containing protein n=1 Tax=Mucilaginibacter sp. Bleaf8 TaxID=2834430 RepID=UPI001BCC18F0|nr:RteC domain-containing protein [Mucilaginibacter sp. Bleaf8]MBS7565550.1 RteC domain-containing protein [Mucilaginibacter sp. Bleaf8]